MPDNFKLIWPQKVRSAPISGNIDNPEGGLDALMQVRKGDVAFLLCEKIYNNVGSVWFSPQGATTRWWCVGRGLGGERRRGGWSSTPPTRFQWLQNPPHADFVISCQTSRFVFPELPQRGRREARRSHFAERWSVPPQHHRLLRLEHCAGGLASWNKQTRAIGLHKTLCRTTPAWATSTTWQRSTVWTWSGRWPGSTSTSTRGSHRSSSTSSSPTTTTSHGTHPDDLYQRGRPDIFRLKQCRGIGNSFEFQTRQHVNRHSMSRWERCTRRSRQASRLRTTRRLPSLFITPAIATAERVKRKGQLEPLFLIWNYVPGDVVEIFLLAHRSPSQLM